MADSAFLLDISKWHLSLSSIVLQITKDVEYFTWEIWTKTYRCIGCVLDLTEWLWMFIMSIWLFISLLII